MSEAHPGPRLSAYTDGELSPAEAAEVEAHLATCAACRVEVEEIRRIARGARAADPAAVAEIDEVTAARFLAEHRRRRREIPWTGWAAAAAAAFLLVSSGALFFGGRAVDRAEDLLRSVGSDRFSHETLGQGQAALSSTIY